MSDVMPHLLDTKLLLDTKKVNEPEIESTRKYRMDQNDLSRGKSISTHFFSFFFLKNLYYYVHLFKQFKDRYTLTIK